MSSETNEFRPIETSPAKRVWPFAIAGAVLVAALLYLGHRNAAAVEVKPAPQAALSNVAPGQSSVAKLAEPVKAAVAQGPNVLGNAVQAAGKLATVARAELDREMGRTHAAQKQVAAYRKQVEELEKELTAARAEIANIQRARQPAPPSDQEQILQMLAPVLRANNDGRP